MKVAVKKSHKKAEKLKRKTYTEENLQKALNEVAKGMSKKLAAKTFDVPRSTLQFRIKNPTHNSKPGPPPILSPEEEETFVNWVKLSSKKGFPKRKEDLIKSVADYIGKTKTTSSFKNGEKWFKLFLARHPSLVFRTPESVTSASSAVSKDDVRGWFRQIQDYLTEKNFLHILSQPGRIFNGDETNFVLCPKTGLVLSSKGERNVYEVEHAQAKTSLTVMFTFCADGNLTPPMVIFPYKRLPGEITSKIPEDWGVGLSENGWMNSDIFYEYIKNILHPHLIKTGKEFPVILFVDGHKSHLTYAVSELCTQLEIILIALYPNCTRLLQPADVAAFKPLKTEWQKTVLEWRRTNPSQALTKTQFVPLLNNTIKKSVKSQTIINGFRETGLCPWNEDEVDYTKCLGAKRNDKKQSHQDPDKKNNKVLTKDNFIKLVGEHNINNIETEQLSPKESSNYLKKIWDYFTDLPLLEQEYNTHFEPQMRTQIENISELQIENMDIIFDCLPSRNVESMERNCELVSQEKVLDEIIMPSNATNAIKDTCQERHFETITHSVQIHSNPDDSTKNITELNKKSIQIIAEEHNPALNNLIMTNCTPVKLNDILILPKTPERKGVRNTTKAPFVLTSAEWKAQENQKIRIKQEKAEGVKKRKEERERKKVEKEKQKKTKIQVKKKSDKKDDVFNILFSKEFYNIAEDGVISEKENMQESSKVTDKVETRRIKNRNFTTAEIEKMLTELDD